MKTRINLSKYLAKDRRKTKIKAMIVALVLLVLTIVTTYSLLLGIDLVFGKEVGNIIDWVLIFGIWVWYAYAYYKERKQKMEIEQIIKTIMEEHKDEV